jgi:ribosomal-protein-alanine N-acetyltransferase
METPTIFTPRLVLRPWSLADTGRLFDILREKDIFLYFPRTTPPSMDKVEKYITHHQDHWQQLGYGHWAVTLRAGSQLIGWNGLEYLPETEETEVAYLLSRQLWGQGYATEAARAALKFGFETAGLERIIGLVHPENSASRRVLEKCGLIYLERKIYWGLELCRYCIERSMFSRQ